MAVSAGAALAHTVTGDFLCYLSSTLLLPTAVYGICIGAILLIAGLIIKKVKASVRTKEKIVVTEVSPNSAAQGKIFPDDIIIAIESKNERVEARRSYQLVDFMLSVRAGDVVKVEIERDGVLQTVEIAFSEANLSEIP